MMTHPAQRSTRAPSRRSRHSHPSRPLLSHRATLLSTLTLTGLLSVALSACDSEEGSTSDQGLSGGSAGQELDVGVGGEAGVMSDMSEADMSEADMSEADLGAPDMGELDMGELDMGEPDMMSLPECANGLDDDGDGLIDYPRDPGCVSLEGDAELDPELFACEDGLDNDADGLIDLDDPACSAPRDPSEEGSCLGHEAIDVSDRAQLVLDSEGEPALLEACRSNDAPELVFSFTLRHPVNTLVFNTVGSAFDTLLSVRRDCSGVGSEVACNDDAGEGRTSAVVLTRPALGDYIIIVDGYGEEQGLVTLNIEGRSEEGEPCPPEGGALRCAPGLACSSATPSEGTCEVAACANGLDDDGDERADYPGDPGCERPEDNSEDDPSEPPACFDGLDNDSDGATDFPNDPDCASASGASEATPAQCGDGLDNDSDGLIDALDPGCDDPSDPNEYNPPACRDGLDNDGDGRVDFPLDPGCSSNSDLSERTPSPAPECGDGLDNDGDGLTDFPDDSGSCTSASDPSEDDPCERRAIRDVSGLTSTRGNTDGSPNDFSSSCGGESAPDELIVWRVEPDRELASLSVTTANSDVSVTLTALNACGDPQAEELACSTQTGTNALTIGPRAAGEDVYLLIDGRFSFGGIWRAQLDARLAVGARCDGPLTWRCTEGASCLPRVDGTSRCVVPQCADGLDNNEDGRVDYPNDPGCLDPLDDLERAPAELPECANDVDDDGDGLFDYGEDPDCYAASDAREAPECRDGVDNDGDGRTDFEGSGRADLSCTCPNDPTEDAQEPACSDGCDNDSDGLIDAEDPGCLNPQDNDEFNEPACRDGLDNDGDGRADFPNDPGCESLNDLSELTPEPAPSCGNGVDDDGDGLVDFGEDDGCVSASDDTEESVCDLPPPSLPASGVVASDTSVGGSVLRGTQVGSCAFGAAPEQLWHLTLNHPATLTLNTLGAEGAGASFSTVLYARQSCRPTLPCPLEEPSCVPSSSELACARDPLGGGRASLTFEAPQGELFLFVDGFGTQAGSYELSVRGEYPLGGGCDDSLAFVTCPEGSLCVSPTEGEPTVCVTTP